MWLAETTGPSRGNSIYGGRAELCPFEELKEVRLSRKLTRAELVFRKSHSRSMGKGLKGDKSGVQKTG